MSNISFVSFGSLRVAEPLAILVSHEILSASGVAPESFWAGLEAVVESMGPRNRALLERRDELQALIDKWLREHRDEALVPQKHEAFLRSIGYLVDEPSAIAVNPQNVDPEIAFIAGPQLVVPLDNARYALNAANARWGSLYDALYGTDVIEERPGLERGADYNPARGTAVVERAMAFLDQAVPLAESSHADIAAYRLAGDDRHALIAAVADGTEIPLADPNQFRGHRPGGQDPAAVLFENNGLHIEIVIDRDHPVGATHPAGIRDVILESAVTTIQDCEDSVAAVDVYDKCRVYANWLGLFKGTLEASFTKDGKQILRRLAADRVFVGADAEELVLPGRSLLLVRNVGLHMYTDAVLDGDGQPIPEGILDAFVTVAAATRDLTGEALYRNSRAGSIYIVKPKLHGPEEVAFTVELFGRVEKVLGLADSTIKLGIMDEERRTTLNLKSCIAAAQDRVIFINTGFLDRTGDEIHTLMEAGPFIPKQEVKQAHWMLAYEDWNVDVGLACGLQGHAQIGKGMWAMPEEMADMVDQKIAHPEAGASTAWVPSPTAATLHAMHYHAVAVSERQAQIDAEGRRVTLHDLLVPSLLGNRTLSPEEIDAAVKNNAQSILGYVVRWVEQGIGCSKVPDINDVALMEDRATLRISSQHLANWLRHGLISNEDVEKSFRAMAEVVDRQNAGDPDYRLMAVDYDASEAFQAALQLVLTGAGQPNGYTEFTLHERRRAVKARAESQEPL